MKEDKGIVKFVKSKSRAVTVWIAIFLFFFLSLWAGWLVSFVHALLLTFCLWSTSKIEAKYLIKLLEKKNVYLFYLVNFFLVVVMSMLTVYWESLMLIVASRYSYISMPQLSDSKMYFLPLLIRLVLYVATVAITVISTLQMKEKENQRIKNELKSEKLDMELRFLKSQITPHFLFNALNNIYSLVYIHDEKAPQSVLKLSEMLRYVMVDCQVDTISLEKELKYIDSYIDFQQMSMENKSNVVFEKDIKDSNFKIPPMIIQPLVENSFKHSRLANDPSGFVYFHMLQEDDRLMFVARNSVKGLSSSLMDPNKKDYEKIGLNNVKKRLELFYGDNYYFETKFDDNCYVATIKIGFDS